MIKANFTDLLSPLNRDHVAGILNGALEAVDPRTAVEKAAIRQGDDLVVNAYRYELGSYPRVLVVGFGKASIPMAAAMQNLLREKLTAGIVISKHLDADFGSQQAGKIKVIKGSHPVPDQASITATQSLLELCRDCSKEDLVICLISGGGSALCTLPVDGITLDDMQSLTRLLLRSGAEIGEINTLRKHLDRVKGGGLARWLYPARVVTLIVSDVIGSPLEVIASGPTVGDSSTFEDAIRILDKYHLTKEVPGSVLAYLQKGLADHSLESVKPGDPALERVQNLVIASSYQAAQAAAGEARRRGFNSLVLTTFQHGEAAQAGMLLASILKQVALTGEPIARPACLIAGGETTVTVHGAGLGGRNLEIALGSVYDLAGVDEVALVTLSTDGEDGPTDAAGALVTGGTLTNAQKLQVNPQLFLANNDSYHFFEQVSGLIKTGPTGTNVNDLAFLFAF